MRSGLPRGTVTFLFTDVEESTKLLHDLGPGAYADALAEHRRIVREACAAEGGVEVDTQGDAFFFAFSSARGAVGAAQAITDGLSPGPILLRIGLHTGTPLVTEEGYVGDDVHLAARVAAAGHGGQVLLSKATGELVGGRSISDLGEHRLKDFEDAVSIYQLGTQRFPPVKTISNTNLPRPASSFVGRQRERDELVSMLSDGTRLVTLSGPGGSGKTRLAIEAASELVAVFKAGVFWVGLSALRDPTLVTQTIAQTVGAKEDLAAHVSERELLLLLDNFEQVVEAAPELSHLLEACPNLKLLVTSRELLRIRGEVEYAMSPLSEPEAVELFCERARLEPDNTIAELCRRLDDMPLAVELAAARTHVLTPAQILDRLAQRLDLLTGGRDADPRQQTLRATIEWSYDLLVDEEQTLFRRLAVFRGGCSLEAAEDVSGADLDVLQSLVDKSLLRHSGERFSMLETIREYARERLATANEEAKVRRQHALFFLEFAERAAPRLDEGRGPAVEFVRLGLEHDNLRAALEWARDCEEGEILLRLAAGLETYWLTRGFYQEMDTWLPVALEGAKSPAQARMTVLRGVWYQAIERKDPAVPGLVAEFRSLAEQEGDEHRVLLSMSMEIPHLMDEGDFEGARRRLVTVVERADALGDRAVEATATLNLGYVGWRAGDYRAGLDHSTKALELFRQREDDAGVAHALSMCGWNLLGLPDPASAARYLRESLAMLAEIGSFRTYRGVIAVEGLGLALVALQEPERSAQLLAATARLRKETGAGFDDENEKQTLERAVTTAKAALGEDAFAAAWACGEAMTPDEIVGLAFAE